MTPTTGSVRPGRGATRRARTRAIRIAGGTYRDREHLRPRFGGTDEAHPIEYCADGGDVVLRGPANTTVDYINTFDRGTAFVNVNYNCPTAHTISVDGECTAVRDGPATGCRINRGTQVSGQDLKLCFDHANTYGYPGFNIDNASANRVAFCGNMGTHGTPVLRGDDTGDTLYFNQAATGRFLVDGTLNRAGSIDLNMGGHAVLEGQGGTVTVRNVRFNNDWSTVAGFSRPDGNRAAIFNSRAGVDWVVGPNVLINRTGKGADSRYQESFKCEGQRTAIFDSVFRNTHAYFMLAASISTSSYAEDCFLSHSVFDNGGAIAVIEDYCDELAGRRRAHGYKLFNNIAKNVAKPWNPTFANALFVIQRRCRDSYPMTSALLEVNGLTVQDANCERLGVYVYPSPGFVPMAAAMSRWPDMFKNYTCSSDINLDNAPADGTDLTLHNMKAAYTPIEDSLSIDRGVALTTANGAGTSSTSLSVHNGCGFDNPAWGPFQIHIEGAGNVTVTAITALGAPGSATACRKTYSISPAATWVDGAAVNFPFTGSGPDRGLTH